MPIYYHIVCNVNTTNFKNTVYLFKVKHNAIISSDQLFQSPQYGVAILFHLHGLELTFFS